MTHVEALKTYCGEEHGLIQSGWMLWGETQEAILLEDPTWEKIGHLVDDYLATRVPSVPDHRQQL
jgi:hypothetical protein